VGCGALDEYIAAVSIADQFDGFLVDLDGVVWIGREPVPGSAAALRELIAAGKELVFVTNNPAREPAAYAERLGSMGVDVEPQRVVTAGMVAARLAAGAAAEGGAVFVLGMPALKKLVADKVKPEDVIAEVMAACYKEAFALYDETAAKNPAFKKVYEAWKPFRADEYLWFRVGENSFDNLIYAQQAAGR